MQSSSQALPPAAGAQTLSLWIIAVLFCFVGWNKLHILWAAPLCFFLVHFVAVRNVPVLSPIILSISKFVLAIIFIGIEKHNAPSRPAAPDKLEVIRDLVKGRYQDHPTDFASARINSMSKEVLMKVPEATIVTVVEAYAQLKKEGFAEQDIFQKMEDQKARTADTATLPAPLTLSNYVKYRLKLEHPHSVQFSDDFIDATIRRVSKAFE